MITKDNFKILLDNLGFSYEKGKCVKNFDRHKLIVDFQNEQLIYPDELKVNDKTTSNFSKPENFVVFECIHRLLTKGYLPKHLEIEPKWSLGHSQKSGKADIGIKDNNAKNLAIIECKTYGSEFEKALRLTELDGGQIFSYAANSGCSYIALYASDAHGGFSYRLISLKDNETLLENNPTLKSYKEARAGAYGDTAKALFEVWQSTYKKSYIKGLFEADVAAYDLEKKRFSIHDLKVVSEDDIAKIYHKFATILRQHNVSSRENAFDKLVNLFLCKIVDEMQNPNELQFYYKGIAYDDEFSFIDRLQKLYKEGMKEFLNEEITYIENSEIDKYFELFNAHTIKQKVKEAIKELKFFTSNDFAFIEVHNKRLFYQNFEILLKIVLLFQEIYLTNSDENQFLGDLFEGFLDQGVKQNEGQYFTPMPIVKFIIHSLPQRSYTSAIDYACGAGHFLNEFAKEHKEALVVGVEKEYRLSKVSKVSSFMYGNKNIQIIYDDALKKSLTTQKFDLLISNPPYSVKGFLETLLPEDIEAFELSKYIDLKSYPTNNSIECFFIEKAKHLLNDNGLAAIIVPISILDKTNSKLFIKTREIVLKYFNLKAIVKLPTKTFGKTGTTTIVLYLQKRDTKVDIAKNLQDIAFSLFEGDFSLLEKFQYKHIFDAFLEFMGYDKEAYKKFLLGKYDKRLFTHEIFQSYKERFIKLLKAKEKKRGYKVNRERFVQDTKAKERERFYFFALAWLNKEVFVVLPPNKNDTIKKFLGYEWSEAKGNEGIKYLANLHLKSEQLDRDDIRTLGNIITLNDIQTPLYNPKDFDDSSKINKALRDFLEGKSIQTNEYIKLFELKDMLDLQEVDFSKVINLEANKEIEIKSRWKLVRLGDVVNLYSGKRPKGGAVDSGVLSIGGEHIQNGKVDLTNKKYIPKAFVKNIPNAKILLNDILMCKDGAKSGKVAFVDQDIEAYVNEHNFILRSDSSFTNKYIFEYLFSNFGQLLLTNIVTGSAQGGINSTNLKNLKIPLPPKDVQEKIVQECEAIDSVNEKLRMENGKLKEKIEEIVKNQKNFETLEKIFLKVSTSIEPTRYSGEVNYIGLENIEAQTGKLIGNVKTRYETIKSTKTVFEKNDILYGKLRPNLNKVYLAEFKGICSTDIFVLRIKPQYKHLLKFYKFYFLSKEFNEKVLKTVSGQQLPRTSWNKIKSLYIPLPDANIQRQFILQIEELENKIEENSRKLDASQAKKEEILRKYL